MQCSCNTTQELQRSIHTVGGTKQETKVSYQLCPWKDILKKCCTGKRLLEAREILFSSFSQRRECSCDGVLLKFTLSKIYSLIVRQIKIARKKLIFSAPAFFCRARPSCECRSSHLCPINFAPIISARISQCRCLLGIQPVLSYALACLFFPTSPYECICAQTNLRQALYSVSPPKCLDTHFCIQRFSSPTWI